VTTPPAAPGAGPFQPGDPIRTPRLLLRPYALGDVDALYDYQRLPEVHRYLYTEPRTRAEVEAIVAQRAGSLVVTEAGQGLPLVAELAQTGELVGDCVLFWSSQNHKQGERGTSSIPRTTAAAWPSRPSARCCALASRG
jgi:RimJ/RimL family protein N-acetyltransferase